MAGNTAADPICIKCGKIKPSGQRHYVARAAKCQMWLCGCRMCFPDAKKAKTALVAHLVKREGSCGYNTCDKCKGMGALFGDLFSGLGGLGGLGDLGGDLGNIFGEARDRAHKKKADAFSDGFFGKKRKKK